MNPTLVSAFAALFGSLIGGLTTLATAALTQRYGTRSKRIREGIAKREALYAEFIDEAARRVLDALEHEISEANQVVHLYGLFCRIQLVCSQPVVDAAEHVIKATARLYLNPNIRLRDLLQGGMDPIHGGPSAPPDADPDAIAAFSRACRAELEMLQRQL